jgi:hypothetical protein
MGDTILPTRWVGTFWMFIKHALQSNLMSMAHCGNYLVWEIAVVRLVVKFGHRSYALYTWENKEECIIRLTCCNGNHGDLTGSPICMVTLCMALWEET